MAIQTVGAGQSFATIAQAVQASSSGDTIAVQAGLYRNDFITIRHDLILTAIGGPARLVATVAPPNGKAIITEGGPGVDVVISGFDISGARVRDGNGAAIRYEGGTLTLNGVTIHHNENGILAASDPTGTIAIARSSFTANGSGSGTTHGIYVNRIGQFTLTDSTITGTAVGHQVKSRAAATTITGSLLADGAGGTGSYLIDLPNGGTAVIQGNMLQKGTAAQNPHGISFGAEGNLHPASSLTVRGNTLVTDRTGRGAAVRNVTGTTVQVQGNTLYGWATTAEGPAALSGNLRAAARPTIALPGQPATPPVATPPVAAPPVEKPPVATPPVAAPPAEKPPVATPPVAAPPAEKPPVATPPVAAPPVEKPPVDTPPVAAPPVEKPPAAAPIAPPPPTKAPPAEIPPITAPPIAAPPLPDLPLKEALPDLIPSLPSPPSSWPIATPTLPGGPDPKGLPDLQPTTHFPWAGGKPFDTLSA